MQSVYLRHYVNTVCVKSCMQKVRTTFPFFFLLLCLCRLFFYFYFFNATHIIVGCLLNYWLSFAVSTHIIMQIIGGGGGTKTAKHCSSCHWKKQRHVRANTIIVHCSCARNHLSNHNKPAWCIYICRVDVCVCVWWENIRWWCALSSSWKPVLPLCSILPFSFYVFFVRFLCVRALVRRQQRTGLNISSPVDYAGVLFIVILSLFQ